MTEWDLQLALYGLEGGDEKGRVDELIFFVKKLADEVDELRKELWKAEDRIAELELKTDPPCMGDS